MNVCVCERERESPFLGHIYLAREDEKEERILFEILIKLMSCRGLIELIMNYD